MAATVTWRRRAGVGLACLATLAGASAAADHRVGAAAAEPTAPARACGPVTGTAVSRLDLAAGGQQALPVVRPAGPDHVAPVDMDADGSADDVTWSDTTVTIVRGDGTLTLTDVPPDPPYPGYPAPHGRSVVGDDLDGDGRTELVVTRWFLPGFRSGYRYETAIVAGTTPPGTAALAQVALSFQGDLAADVDGDGRDDLWVQGSTSMDVPLPVERWVSGVAALADPTTRSIPTDLPQIGTFADLDHDSDPDAITLGSPDGGAAPAVRLASGTIVEAAIGWVPIRTVALRSDARTVVRFDSGTGTAAYLWLRGASCAGPWVQAATALLLGRGATAADFVGFGPLDEPDLATRLGRTRALVRSQTARGHQVDDAFARYLGRSADPRGRAWWVAQLRSGGRTSERLVRELVGSPERLRRSGGTAAGWVDDVYPLVYGRAADPAGRAYWTAQANRLGVARTAARMFGEPAADRVLARTLLAAPEAYDGAPPADLVELAAGWRRSQGWDEMAAQVTARPELYLHAQA